MSRLRIALTTACLLVSVFAFLPARAAYPDIQGTCQLSGDPCSPPDALKPKECPQNDTCVYAAGICSGGKDASVTPTVFYDGHACLKSSDCGTGPDGGICQYNSECFPDAGTCKSICSAGGNTANFDTAHPTPPGLHCRPTDHLCYCTGKPYNLEIPIGPTTQVSNIGDYVQGIYRFLLGFSIVVAIIMVMLGGLQYLMAANTGETKNAKERITNAAIGLALLFGCALILTTVNPQLLTLQPPTLPAIDLIDLKGSTSGCAKTQCCYYPDQTSCEQTTQVTGGCAWTKELTNGFCLPKYTSDGQNGHPCNNGACANAALKCVDINLPGYAPQCSDGQPGSYCRTDDDCAATAHGANPCNTDTRTCGGSTGAALGSRCSVASDCQDNARCTNTVCVLKTANDQGGACATDGDCQSGFACRNKVCAEQTPLGNGGGCVTAQDCQTGFICTGPGQSVNCANGTASCVCTNRAPSAPCFSIYDCASRICTGGVCQ